MKKKDIITLVIAIAIFMVAGGVIYRYLVPPSKNTGIKVEVPRPVVPEFDTATIEGVLKNKDQVQDFTPDISPDANAQPKPIVQ